MNVDKKEKSLLYRKKKLQIVFGGKILSHYLPWTKLPVEKEVWNTAKLINIF